ncbi:MAG: hypothetical protein IKV36_01385, partial [Clostridia bacterium]|nr:hypothetical protein [Clostridia bacterium]
MKATKLLKKSLALVIALALVVLSVPMSIFMASAEETAAPTPDATDIGSYVNFYQSAAQLKEYDTTGSLKLSSGILTTYGDNYTEGGTYYASVKMTFDPDFE